MDDKKVTTGAAKTERFKEHLQAIIFQKLGAKVSKEKAWDLYKAFNFGTVEFVANEPDLTLSLAGVGTYKVLKSEARGKKAGVDKDGNAIAGAKAYEFVPRFKTYHSDKIAKFLAQKFGQEDFGVEFTSVGLFAKDAATGTAEAPKTVAPKKTEAKTPAAKTEI